jgi:hypothetical protein
VPVAPDVALVHETIEALAALGLDAALTEVDAPSSPTSPTSWESRHAASAR